jgi:hypothetical protein
LEAIARRAALFFGRAPGDGKWLRALLGMKCTNLPDLNQYVQRTYRKGSDV